MNKKHLQMLLTTLLELKVEVLKLHKGEPTKYNLLVIPGICKFITYYLNLGNYIIPEIKYIFTCICEIWPDCRIDFEGDKDKINCVVSFEVYVEQARQQIQWTNLRRLELLEFSIKYLQEKLNE